MKIKSLKWFIALAMLSSFLSCRQLEIEEEGNPIMQIIGEMSLKEKVCQMFIPDRSRLCGQMTPRVWRLRS